MLFRSQNLATTINSSNGNATGTGYAFTADSEVVNIPQIGTLTSKYVTVQNNYPAVSTSCCPNLFGYSTSTVSVSASTLYTYSILYKCDSGYTHANFLYRYEYAAGSVYVTEAGIHSTTNRTHLGNGWYWAWGTFTTSATTATLTLYSFYYQYSTSVDKFYVAKVLLTPGTYTGLHPKYWPTFNTTKSNTQAIADLTGNNTVTANSLTYARSEEHTSELQSH